MKINEKIKEVLNERGVTQSWTVSKMNEVNPRLDMDKNKMSSIVNNSRKVSGDELLAFCMALKVSPDIFAEQNE